jgi:hypothetical protein
VTHLDPDGRLAWTTPTGHTLTTEAHDHRVDAVRPPSLPPDPEPDPPPF